MTCLFLLIKFATIIDIMHKVHICLITNLKDYMVNFLLMYKQQACDFYSNKKHRTKFYVMELIDNKSIQIIDWRVCNMYTVDMAL